MKKLIITGLIAVSTCGIATVASARPQGPPPTPGLYQHEKPRDIADPAPPPPGHRQPEKPRGIVEPAPPLPPGHRQPEKPRDIAEPAPPPPGHHPEKPRGIAEPAPPPPGHHPEKPRGIAEPVPPPPGHRPGRGERERAGTVLRETAVVLERAQQAARRGQQRDGLGRAWAHQEEARECYRSGRYERAVVHSMHAREIALSIIDANRRGPKGPRKHRSYEHELDNQLHIRIVDDKVALKLRINLN